MTLLDFIWLLIVSALAVLHVSLLFWRLLAVQRDLDRLDWRFLEHGEGDRQERRRLVDALRRSRGAPPLKGKGDESATAGDKSPRLAPG